MRGLWVRAARLLEQGWKPAGKWLENGLPLLPGRWGTFGGRPRRGKEPGFSREEKTRAECAGVTALTSALSADLCRGG